MNVVVRLVWDVRQVGMRIGAVADDGHGGGSVGHMKVYLSNSIVLIFNQGDILAY